MNNQYARDCQLAGSAPTATSALHHTGTSIPPCTPKAFASPNMF